MNPRTTRAVKGAAIAVPLALLIVWATVSMRGDDSPASPAPETADAPTTASRRETSARSGSIHRSPVEDLAAFDSWILHIVDEDQRDLEAVSIDRVDRAKPIYDATELSNLGLSTRGGRFEIERAEAKNEPLLMIHKQGYSTAHVRIGAPGEHRITLERTGLHTVRVIDPAGRPIPEAIVTLFTNQCGMTALSGNRDPSTSISSRSRGSAFCECKSTNDAGEADFSVLTDQTHSANASKDGFFTYETGSVSPERSTIRLAPLWVAAVDTGQARGRVLSAKMRQLRLPSGWRRSRHVYGELAAAAYKTVLEKRFSHLDFFVLPCVSSDSEESLPIAEAELLVEGIGHATSHLVFQKAPYNGETIPLRMSAQALGTVQFVVSDLPDAAAWQAPDVFLCAPMIDGNRLGPSIDVRPGEAYQLPVGAYAMLVGDNRRRVGSFDLQDGRTTLIEVSRSDIGSALELAVKDASGEPPWGVRAELIRDGVQVASFGILDARQFVIGVAPGSYSVHFSIAGTVFEEAAVDVAPGEVQPVLATWRYESGN